VISDLIERLSVKLLYSVVMLGRDVEHLHLQSSWMKGRVV